MPKLSLQKGERLIAEIQANKVLYDSTHKEYSDLALKSKVWSSVAAKSGMRTAHEAKSMWKNLRDCYRICRSKLNANPNARMWRFYNHMKFLAPYIKYRKMTGGAGFDTSITSLTNTTKEKEEDPPAEIAADITDKMTEFTTVYYWDENERKVHDDAPMNCEEPAIDEELEPGVESRLQSPFDTDSSVEGLQEGGDGNSLKMFFDAMYASTNGLPLSLQRTVKKKVFAAVLAAEEEAEQLHDPPQPELRIKLEP